MKTSVIEVHDMLSVLSVAEVEKRIGEVPGVESVTVNFAASGATVRYDETRLEIADVKSAVRQRGYGPAEPATPAPVGNAPPGKAAQSATPESPPAEPPAAPEPTPAPTSGASKPPDASAAPDEKPDKTVPDKS